jgi:hypothetical protein
LQLVAEESRAHQVVSERAAAVEACSEMAAQETSPLQQAERQQLIQVLVAVVEVLTWQM